ncbi:muscle M-line assembly protein unc-89 [Monomorium pharaonis]|uniref:muscle M-line assembly protein unc-89 n=1 Tax=Monomorium pharaonis TaxID=307658 RepID=UPI00063EE0A6|nr:muscle M-line assembly protein unc-89 [Monomorium pharaonis]XP_012539686.1 muscle M-line assembly protein unc-89 [Monomorium pharaonis]XP_012539688.1 muscle M-line assembly protein unc-89 [Monomorium pharaonis]XP_036140363.1 muscle M-line assembly protein unc-89 [Monomorium pharaonis]
MMEVISTRRYEARPPANTHSSILVDPENSVALIKEEEWETRKKKEITTTRQIETRVKRQVVLEDGEVVVDSGPFVTTNTTEDVEQQEHTTQERRTTGDQPQEVDWRRPAAGGTVTGNGGNVVQKELNETVVRSREEIEERLETEDRQQLGDISDEAYQKAVRNNRGDLRVALAESSKQLAPQSGPRVIQHTTRSNKVIDTEKTLEKKELKADGLIVTEKKRTVEHEEIKDDEVPDDGEDDNDDASETRKESSQRYVKKREEDVVDYISAGERVGREMRYVAETTEGERIGDWSPSPTGMRTTRFHKYPGFSDAARKDALTKKPLDLEEEDEARKFETSKWLESHFGSDSRSSHGSLDADDSPLPTGTNTSYINVTMKSCAPKERDYQNASSSRNQRRGRESGSPSEYFHGISEWSERYQGKEKQNHARANSPVRYVEAPRVNGHAHGHKRNQVESSHSKTYESFRREYQDYVDERQRTPSPPVRRRSKEQWAKSEERISSNEPPSGRTSSPVHVVQRTWESRNRDVRSQTPERDYRSTTPRSRSISPKSPMNGREEKKSDSSRASKGQGSKYKIGESFRKLVGKLRSASTERKNKRASGGSTSQLTQTDDNGPTYMQYNVIDRNIPFVSERDMDENSHKPPERPPRSPRNPSGKVATKTTTRLADHGVQEWQRSESTPPPLQRYYLGEDPFGGSIYGREKGYENDRDRPRQGRSRGSGKIAVDSEHSVATSSSLGRFSKSTGRLTVGDHERDEHFRSTQTLPRNLHSAGDGQSARPQARRHQKANIARYGTPGKLGQHQQQQQQYSSMINISIKNTVSTSPKVNAPPAYSTLQAPPKPERTYKSTLSRSKSFNVEADRNGGAPAVRAPYTSNLHLNRLDETPPLKSPGILASISRSNRDLSRDGKY